MALNINGTTGISGVDGSASAPALQGTDSNTGINFASDTVNINTGGVTRAIVDSNGNFRTGTITDTSGNHSSTTEQIYEGRAKIFVCFNGTNTAIRSHFGVTSITDEDTGDFSVNFSTAMSSTGYCAVYGSSNWETNNSDSYTTISDSNESGAKTTSKIRIRCMRMRFDTSTPSFKDAPFISVAIFGDQ